MNDVSNFVGSRIQALFFLSYIPVYCLKISTETLFGVISTPWAILSNDENMNKFADEVKNSGLILPYLLCGVVNVLNPDMQVKPLVIDDELNDEEKKIVDGFFTKKISDLANEALDDAACTRNSVVRGLRVRAVILAAVAGCVVSRTLDLALGIILGLAVIATCGTLKNVNDLAVDHLSSLALIQDLCHGAREFVRPSILKE